VCRCTPTKLAAADSAPLVRSTPTIRRRLGCITQVDRRAQHPALTGLRAACWRKAVLEPTPIRDPYAQASCTNGFLTPSRLGSASCDSAGARPRAVCGGRPLTVPTLPTSGAGGGGRVRGRGGVRRRGGGGGRASGARRGGGGGRSPGGGGGGGTPGGAGPPPPAGRWRDRGSSIRRSAGSPLPAR